MLLTKNIKVCATGNLLKILQTKGYVVSSHQQIMIDVNDLPKNTRKKVKVQCDVCGLEYEKKYGDYLESIKNGGYLSCNKCKGDKIKETTHEIYGVDNISQLESIKKRKEKTLIENYGTNNILEINKDKIYEIYGVDNVSKNEKIKEKIKISNLEKYGVENPSQNETIKEKRYNTNIKKYGTKYPTQTIEIKEKLKKNYKKKIKERYSDLDIIDIDDFYNITIKCDKGHTYKTRSELIYDRKRLHSIECVICNPINSYSTSGKEIEICNFIKEKYEGKIITNSRKIINPYELDIYLPDLNLAFEFNGLYWHNELYKDKNYHSMKYNLCKDKNIHLIQIWEDDWNYKQEIIKSMILNKLGKNKNKIYARKTEIREIEDTNLIREFLEQNHIQGFVGSTIKIGLFFENELVSLMNFKKQNVNYELNRFCNKLNTSVIGSASKLLKYFIKKYSDDIYTFANLSYSNGSLYNNLNFKISKILSPDYSYVFNNKRKHKFGFRGKNERENMLDKKIYRIYDTGKIKYIYKN